MESRDGAGSGRSAATFVIAAVLVCAAASQAKSLLAPLAAALFIIGVVWPAQRRLQSLMPKLAALAITILFTATVCLGFASLAVWAFGRVGQFLIADAARYQAFFERATAWLAARGRRMCGLWAQHFNVGWLLRVTQYLTGRANSMLTFWLITLVYIALGLIEVDDI